MKKGFTSLVLVICVMFSGCGQSKVDKVIRYTYLPQGEINASMPENYDTNVELFTIWTEEAPATTGEPISLEDAKKKVTDGEKGCWQLIESSNFRIDVEALSAYTLTLGNYTRTYDGKFGQYNEQTLEFYELLRTDDNSVYFRISQQTAENFNYPGGNEGE